MCLNRPSSRADKALEELKEEFKEADVRLIPMDLRTCLSNAIKDEPER